MDVVLNGRYRLLRTLGQGGMGEVWRGLDTRLNRPVAVKLIRLSAAPSAADYAEAVRRFEREAQAMASLNHPNVVAAYDFGIDAETDTPYLVMEMIEGRPLTAELTDRASSGAGPFPIGRVKAIATDICAGLAAAHAAGVVHRDLKPANLMTVTSTGRMKIVDFGTARGDRLSRVTQTGLIVGTVAYIAPEMLELGEIDGRADLYALGCVLYELLTSRSAFDAIEPAQFIAAHLHRAPTPLRELLPDAPEALETLLLDMLAKEVTDRPATASEVSARLAAALPSVKAIVERPDRASGVAATAQPSAVPPSAARKPSAAQKRAAQKLAAAQKPAAGQKPVAAQKLPAVGEPAETRVETADPAANLPLGNLPVADLPVAVVESAGESTVALPAQPRLPAQSAPAARMPATSAPHAIAEPMIAEPVIAESVMAEPAIAESVIAEPVDVTSPATPVPVQGSRTPVGAADGPRSASRAAVAEPSAPPSTPPPRFPRSSWAAGRPGADEIRSWLRDRRVLAVAGLVAVLVVAGVVWAVTGNGGASRANAGHVGTSPAAVASQRQTGSPSHRPSSSPSPRSSAPPLGFGTARAMKSDPDCGAPSQLSFNSDGSQLAGAGSSGGSAGAGIACVWTVSSGSIVYKATGYHRVLGAQFDSNDRYLTYATSGGSVPIQVGAVGATGGSIRGSLSNTTHLKSGLEAVAVSPNGDTIAVSYTGNGTIQFYDMSAHHWIADVDGRVSGKTGTLTFNPSGSRIAHAEAGGVSVLDTSSIGSAGTKVGWKGPGASAAAFVTNDKIITCSGHQLSLYDVTSGTAPKLSTTIADTCVGIAVRPGSRDIAISTSNRGVALMTMPAAWS